MSFKNKVAIITGGGQGIGLAICERFLKQKVSIVIAEANSKSGALAEKKLSAQGKAKFIATDVAKEKSVQALVNQTIKIYGRIDFLVNNAAISCNKPIDDISFAEWKKVIEVNLSGAFLCSKYCAVHLKSCQGAIVNIASTRAMMSEPNTEAYSASKAGIVGLTHALALSLGPEVRVNCISPGWIDTNKYLPNPNPALTPMTTADHRQHPVGRVGLPADIAEMVFYLSSEKSRFITGQNFIIDGGMTKKMIYVG